MSLREISGSPGKRIRGTLVPNSVRPLRHAEICVDQPGTAQIDRARCRRVSRGRVSLLSRHVPAASDVRGRRTRPALDGISINPEIKRTCCEIMVNNSIVFDPWATNVSLGFMGWLRV